MASEIIQICYTKIEINPPRRINPTSLRGFLGYLFINDSEFHHHSAESSYHYPLVQYKVINNKLYVMGLNDYAKIVFYKISQLEYITLVNEKVQVTNIDLNTKSFVIKEQKNRYKFASPWIALNKKNYYTYKSMDKKNRKQFLAKIFIGNVLSALKGLNIFLNFKVQK